MSTRRPSLITVLVLPLVLVLSLVSIGVASARSTPAAQPQTAIATPTITIHSFSYSVPRSVRHGVLVKVVNEDGVAHTVTSNRAGKFDITIAAHSSKSFRAPRTPMKYGFHCSFHPSMAGVLKVR
jgi:plastocyanin